MAGAAGIPDSSSGGSAQPPRRYAAGPEKEDLCQCKPRPPGFCPQLSQKDVNPQHHTWLWGHLRGGLQHPRGKTREMSEMLCFVETTNYPQRDSLLNSSFMSHQDAPGSEDREMLARLAANAHNSQSADDEAAIEKYLRSVLSLENILTLDRLRQVDR